VIANIYLAHTDPARYGGPLTFRPERFLDRQPDLANWLPFGGGIRRCLGAGFATVELREITRQVVTHASFRAATTELEQPKRRAVTMMPRHGTRIIVDQLRPAAGIPAPTRVSHGRDVRTAGSPS